jgi:hypothetical protein
MSKDDQRPKQVPQGLKPEREECSYGTAEAVPSREALVVRERMTSLNTHQEHYL